MTKRTRDHSSSSLESERSSDPSHSATPSTPTTLQVVPPQTMQCALPPHAHTLKFDSIDAFELHYLKEHSNRCSSCYKNFPTTHFLSLHIDEHHNSLREVRQSKGEKTFTCFVEDCDKKCSNPQKRCLHLIDKHMFPKLYNFRVVDTGIDKSTSMLREGPRRRLSTANDTISSGLPRRRSFATSNSSNLNAGPGLKMVNSEDTSPSPGEDAQVDALERSMSSLRFIPQSVRRNQQDRNGK